MRASRIVLCFAVAAGAFTAVAEQAAETARSYTAASAWIPLDSWVYEGLERLGALGLVPSQTLAIRPWTRAECLRQADQASERLKARNAESYAAEAEALVERLREELRAEQGVVLEAVQLHGGAVAGPLLDDSFHFGQTLTGDYGRPVGRGFNGAAGTVITAEYGRFFAYARPEYERARSREPYSPDIRQLISRLDGIPETDADPPEGGSRFTAVEAYAGVRVGDIQFAAGRQSLWWGPTYDAPLSFSNNSLPPVSVRISSVNPQRLPGFLGRLGELRAEFVLGRLEGQRYASGTWFNAQKLSFKLTENLEMGFTRWSLLWGDGHPITVRSFVRNFISTNSPLDPRAVDPGDRKGGFDFRYRVPGLRNWLTLYSDSYCDDDPSPLAAPRRAAISPGILLTRVPHIPRLDLRVESTSTMPMNGDYGGTFIYYNSQYRSGNTNDGNLLGSWVGRDARAVQAWSRYWLSARGRLQVGYRHVKGGSLFLPGGMTDNAISAKASFEVAREVFLESFVQAERYKIPVLGGVDGNMSAFVTLSWEPRMTLGRARH